MGKDIGVAFDFFLLYSFSFANHGGVRRRRLKSDAFQVPWHGGIAARQ